tara:strand:- start:7619 stop:8206 length:588 start_codon:yes stop_codon:yes gene_type:complete
MNKFYQFACNVTAGRTLGCKDVIGGIQKVFLMVYDEDLYTGMAETDNEITELPAITVFQYDLRPNTATFNANFTSDDATGTTYYEQVLDVTLQKIVHEDLNQLDLITKGRTQVWVLDANDNCFLMGAQFGCSVTAGAMSTGTAKGDLSGFTLTFTAQEKENYMVKESAGIGTASYPFDGIDTPGNVTITAGTYPL